MSQDPKTKPMQPRAEPDEKTQPLNALPEQTPDLLQRKVDLDRRTRPAAPQPAPIPGSSTPRAPPSNVAARKAPPSPTAFAAERAQAAAAMSDEPTIPTKPMSAPPTRAPVAPISAEDLFGEAPPKRAPEAPAQDGAPLPLHLAKTDPGRPGPMSPAAPKPAPSMPPAPVQSAALASEEIVARPAALWRRLAAWVVDLAVIGGVVLALLVVASTVIGAGTTLASKLASLSRVALPGAVLGLLFAFVYTTLFAFVGEGRTLGRRLLGIWLVDATGQAPGPIRALVRAGLAIVSFALLLSGFWLALFDRKGQTLHDKLSSTFVVQLEG